jgi:hypothetical protein
MVASLAIKNLRVKNAELECRYPHTPWFGGWFDYGEEIKAA